MDDQADLVDDAVTRMAGGEDPDDVLTWLRLQGASMVTAMKSLGLAHVPDRQVRVWRHKAWTEESARNLASDQDPFMALLEGWGLARDTDPDFEDHLKAASVEQRREVASVMVADAINDVALSDEQVSLLRLLTEGSRIDPDVLGTVESQARELALRNARAAIAAIQQGERGGVDETVWPAVRACRSLINWARADLADDESFVPTVFAGLGDARHQHECVRRVLRIVAEETPAPETRA